MDHEKLLELARKGYCDDSLCAAFGLTAGQLDKALGRGVARNIELVKRIGGTGKGIFINFGAASRVQILRQNGELEKISGIEEALEGDSGKGKLRKAANDEEPAWYAEARKLHGRGLSVEHIAERIKKTPERVSHCLFGKVLSPWT